jgi:hypothetical protein
MIETVVTVAWSLRPAFLGPNDRKPFLGHSENAASSSYHTPAW